MGETTQTRSPLDLVGGFEAYQNRLYQAFLEKAKNMTIAEVLEYDRHLKEQFPWAKKDGLQDGLMGLLYSQKHLTSDNLEMLEPGFGFGRASVFREQLEPHLRSPNPMGVPVPSLVAEGNGLHRRTGEYLNLVISMSNASDEIISRKKSA